jgi:DNA-binding response OmpR family regulator
VALIMLVGGYRALSTAASEVLKGHGYQVAECRTLSDAWKALRTLSPALIVVNTPMVDGDPIGFVRDLRKRSVVSVIVCDRDAERRWGVQAFEAGADDYVGESCSCEELALRIDAILGRFKSDRVAVSTSIQQ